MFKKSDKHNDGSCSCAKGEVDGQFNTGDMLAVAFIFLLLGLLLGFVVADPETEPEPDRKLVTKSFDGQKVHKLYYDDEWYYTGNDGATWCDGNGIPVSRGPVWPWQANRNKLNAAFDYQKGLERGAYLIEKFSSSE